MSRRRVAPIETVDVEPERYELFAPPAYRFRLNRRQFFKSFGAGLVVVCLVEPGRAQDARGRRGGGRGAPQDIGAWLHISETGEVTVFTGKVEVGQNIRTSLAQVVAEELPVPVTSIRLVMADTQLTPYDAGTFGSRTTPDMSRQLRRVAAAAREWLLDLAAEHWQTDRASLATREGQIVRTPGPASISFGKLTQGKKLTRVIADNTPVKSAADWKIAGRSMPKVNGRDLVTGRHQYTTDVSLPDLWHGRILRAPRLGGTLVSFDSKALGREPNAEGVFGTLPATGGDAGAGAKAEPNYVLVRDGDFVGVAATNPLIARRVLDEVKAEWKTTPQLAGKDLFDELKKTGGRAGNSNRSGSMDDGLAAADIRLQQTYTVAYIAHAPLEPRAAVAQWEGDKLTVWTGTQRPFGVRGDLASAFRVPEANVRVIVPDTGSGYGGKHTNNAAIEAARLAKAAGRPVKLVWTREEEFTWAYFRPAGVIEVRSGVKKDGSLTAWEFHNYNSGASSIRTLYEVPNQLVEFHQSRAPLRQGSYRALAATANTFARETHMDELAHAASIDPLKFRLDNTKDNRLRAVLEAAAKAFGWGKKPDPGRGFGLAGGSEKGSYVATCVEVEASREGGPVRVVRALSAFECGAVVNPDQLKNQVEGSMMMGIGGALFEAVQFDDGQILNPKFSSYRVPRFGDTPQIEVVLLDRKNQASSGAGETPIIAIAPAIGNAVFAATGLRLRSLPLAPQGLKA